MGPIGAWKYGSVSGFGHLGWWLIPLLVWTFIWKGLALWKAARGNQKAWFIIFLFLNTVGIVEIIYLFFFATEKLTLATKTTKKSSKSKSR